MTSFCRVQDDDDNNDLNSGQQRDDAYDDVYLE